MSIRRPGVAMTISQPAEQKATTSCEHQGKKNGNSQRSPVPRLTAPEVHHLAALGDTAVHAGVADAGVRAVLGALRLNLNSELAGGGEDERDGAVAAAEGLL